MTRLVIRDRQHLRDLLEELFAQDGGDFYGIVAADFSALVETAHSGEQGCEDSRRLDWLDVHGLASYGYVTNVRRWHIAYRRGSTIREAIDAARSTQNSDTPSPESAVK